MMRHIPTRLEKAGGPACAVTRCPLVAKREGLCVVHALTWLLTQDSAYTPGREARLAAFTARQSLRGALRVAEART